MISFSYFSFSVSDVAGIEYRLDGQDQIVPESEVMPNPRPYYEMEDWQFECPALVFFYLPDKRSDLYDCVKALSDLEFGVNTQCIVQETCSRQKRGLEQ